MWNEGHARPLSMSVLNRKLGRAGMDINIGIYSQYPMFLSSAKAHTFLRLKSVSRRVVFPDHQNLCFS